MLATFVVIAGDAGSNVEADIVDADADKLVAWIASRDDDRVGRDGHREGSGNRRVSARYVKRRQYKPSLTSTVPAHTLQFAAGRNNSRVQVRGHCPQKDPLFDRKHSVALSRVCLQTQGPIARVDAPVYPNRGAGRGGAGYGRP